jgi:hypothetical protein
VLTFGFSAFLKYLCLSERSRRTELRRRLAPASGGYDYHRSLRLQARRLLAGNESLAGVLASAATITKLSERQSVTSALQRLAAWRQGVPGIIESCEPSVYESPSKVFRVRFEPDFSIRVAGQRTAFHIWNTQYPRLLQTQCYLALYLAEEGYAQRDDAPDDVGVLSVRDPITAYVLKEAPDLEVVVAAVVDQLEEDISGGGSPPPAEERPPA